MFWTLQHIQIQASVESPFCLIPSPLKAVAFGSNFWIQLLNFFSFFFHWKNICNFLEINLAMENIQQSFYEHTITNIKTTQNKHTRFHKNKNTSNLSCL
jgi:hypothetical protein